MTKLHAFVDTKGKVVATGPAPAELSGPAGEGPIFVGFSPANGASDFKAFEVNVEDDVTLGRRDGNVSEFHSRIGELIRTRKNVRQIEYRR